MKKLLLTLTFLLFSSPLIAQEAPMTVQERSDAGLAIIPSEPPKYKPGEQLENAKAELGLGDLELIATAAAGPYSKAYQYKGANTDLLYKMFEDQRLRSKWVRVAKIISIVSEDSGLLKLKEYITTPDSKESENRFRKRSRRAAMTALIEQGEERGINWIMPFATEYTSIEAWQNSIPTLKLKDAEYLAMGTLAAIGRLRTPESVVALEGILEKHQSKRQVAPQSINDRQKRFEEFIGEVLSRAKSKDKDSDHAHTH